MRSLAVKLTLAFLLVGLTGAMLVALLVRNQTQREFDRLVVEQNQGALVTNLTRYYQAHGTWAGVETVFPLPGGQFNPPGSPNQGSDPGRRLFIITDGEGRILLGGRPELLGRTLRKQDLAKGVPLDVDGRAVGWLIFAPTVDRWGPETPEGAFLLNIRRATILSAMAATGIALILGGVLAYTLTRPLREVIHATQELTSGRLGTQVPVRSQDELGELAQAFNQMSAGLAHSTKLRRKLTADIAHDLRTPLSVITGYTEALSDGVLEPTPEMFTVMHTEARHLSRLVDDLKTLSLADAGELPLAPQVVLPDVLIKRAADTCRALAEGKGITLATDIHPGLPQVDVDVERMAQVLDNLIDNALRGTDPGGKIRLSAAMDDQGIALRVADNGTGIPPEYLPHIFERSYVGEKSRQQTSGETGLGLSIAKSLVEAQGGRIDVQSAVGVGTTFTIHLSPAKAP